MDRARRGLGRARARWLWATGVLLGLGQPCLPQGSPPRSEDAFWPAPEDPLRDVREKHLARVEQLTFGGENAEAYFSPDGTRLVLQRRRGDGDCDQIYVYDLKTRRLDQVSSGRGRTTCAYFYPDGRKVLYATTELAGEGCPESPMLVGGRYVWPIYASYDLVVQDLGRGGSVRLTATPGYDAEATLAPDGSRVVFTSLRDGDLELYSMALDGRDAKRLTFASGYDGGGVYSPDSKRIAWRAQRPETPEELARYRELLEQGLVEPGWLEIHVMNADGSEPRQVTDNGAANFAPCWHPDGRRILFASNLLQPGGHAFDLFLVGDDGQGLERVTYHPDFDGFPMFSPDGRKLVWCSNRNATRRGETNVFIAEWVP